MSPNSKNSKNRNGRGASNSGAPTSSKFDPPSAGKGPNNPGHSGWGRRRAASMRQAFVASESDYPVTGSNFLKGIPAPGTPYSPQQPATKELQRMIKENRYQEHFQSAITHVASQPVGELKKIETLDQFYFYVDALVTWIPETRHWTIDGQTMHERTVYLRIVEFYYYFNQETLDKLQSPIAPQSGEDLTPLSAWLRKFAVDWGGYLDTTASAEFLESFKYAPEYNWQDYQKPPEDYGTFNEFFARQFKDIDKQRPVAQEANDRVIVFPAESTFVGQWSISTETPDGPIQSPPSIVIKHIEWSIQELLNDSKYAADFAGGRFCHSFLNTYDYHRLHTPVAGKVLEAKFIPGQVYLQVGLKDQDKETASSDLASAFVPHRYLDADDPTGYQFVQCRGLIVLETENFGKVAVLPMGMAQVSSVVFTNPDKNHSPIQLSSNEREGLDYDAQVAKVNEKIADELVGKQLKKGEMFSFFQFGGSDCVVVFERRANVNVTAQVNVHYPIRSQYAFANY